MTENEYIMTTALNSVRTAKKVLYDANVFDKDNDIKKRKALFLMREIENDLYEKSR